MRRHTRKEVLAAARMPTTPRGTMGPPHVVTEPRRTLEDLDELDEGWLHAAQRRAYGDPHEAVTLAASSLLSEPAMPAMRRPRPRDAPPDSGPAVETGQFSKRKSDR